MRKSYRRYIDDEISSPENELLKLRQQRLEQAAIRLEQRERHIKLQEEKTRLLEEKRRAKEIERKNKKLKRMFFGFLKGVVAAGAVVTTIIGLISELGEAAQTSPVADRAYRSIMRILEQMLSAIKHGGSLAKRAFASVFDKISSVAKSLWDHAKQRFARVEANQVHDSKIIARYIKKDVAIKLGATHRMRTDSSICSFSKREAIASKYVNRAIRLCDKKYNDIVGTVATVGFLHGTILPLLLAIAKGAAIAGLAKSISEPISKNITGPIINRIVNNIKLAAANKGDKTYTEAILGKIKSDMNTLMSILSREKSYAAGKLESAWNRVSGMI